MGVYRATGATGTVVGRGSGAKPQTLPVGGVVGGNERYRPVVKRAAA